MKDLYLVVTYTDWEESNYFDLFDDKHKAEVFARSMAGTTTDQDVDFARTLGFTTFDEGEEILDDFEAEVFHSETVKDLFNYMVQNDVNLVDEMYVTRDGGVDMEPVWYSTVSDEED